jgi:hypothetical protein
LVAHLHEITPLFWLHNTVAAEAEQCCARNAPGPAYDPRNTGARRAGKVSKGCRDGNLLLVSIIDQVTSALSRLL